MDNSALWCDTSKLGEVILSGYSAKLQLYKDKNVIPSHSNMPHLPNSVQQNHLNSVDTGNTICGAIAISIPLCIVLGSVLHKRYRAHRATILRQQVKTLEKLWRLSYKK